MTFSSAKEFSPEDIVNMSDEQARQEFLLLRWPSNNGNPICPKCECKEIYTYKKRQIYKCKNCSQQFSATSETIFASKKMNYKNYLLAISLLMRESKSALKISKTMGVQYRTAWDLASKIRLHVSEAQ